MAQQLEALGWEARLARIFRNTQIYKAPREYYLDDYDLVLLGSPVIGGLPSGWFANNFGLIGSEPPGFYHINDYGIFGATEVEKPYGAGFVTYCGLDAGPNDSKAALETIDMYLDVMGCTCVGQLAVPARGKPRTIPDPVEDVGVRNYGGHHDIENRPNEDDLTRARLWVKDIALDLFTDEGRRIYGGKYLSIS